VGIAHFELGILFKNCQSNSNDKYEITQKNHENMECGKLEY
jgi:hypothetical protein